MSGRAENERVGISPGGRLKRLEQFLHAYSKSSRARQRLPREQLCLLNPEAHTHTHTHMHTNTHTCLLVLVLAPLPDTGHVVSFCKEAKPDRTTKLETPLDVEQPAEAILSCLTLHLWAKEMFTHSWARHTTVSGKDGVQPRVTAPCVRPGL